MPGRLPPTQLRGRLRTSTLLLVLTFLAVLALYLLVRPAGTVASQGGSGSPAATRSGPATTSTTSRTTETSASSPSTTTPP